MGLLSSFHPDVRRTVKGVDHDFFEEALQAVKDEQGVKLDNELSAEALQEVVRRYKEIISREAGRLFPDDPFEQLKGAINAVFKSWNNDRAIRYRQINGIPGEWGTAVNVQAMVFGNMGANSGTGVAFTRDPSTGENVFYGEYLMDAQGEDVVAGIRTPHPISKLKEEMPEVYAELEEIYLKLENHYGICRTSSSPSKKVNSTCSRPGPENGPLPLLSALL